MIDNHYEEYPILVILGPTAVGKTALSLKLAEDFNGEIISADSMQIYRDMDIGTAKVSTDIRAKIPHYMIDIVCPEKNFSVADYQKEVDKIIPEICQKNNLPILVGGTGLYIKAVIQGFLLPEMEADKELRQRLQEKAKKYGNKYVHNMLAEIDACLAHKLHPNDLRRVIRGIEIYKQTGKTKTFYKWKQKQKPPRYHALKIGLTRKRAELYQRINLRVDEMIKKGLIEEVKYLHKKYDLSKTALQALGYKEITGYLQKEYDLKEAKRLIKKNTRNFAKRQLTWFRRDDDIHWFNLSKMDIKEIRKQIKTLINDRF